MPRPDASTSPLFVEFQDRLANIEAKNRRAIDAAENAAKNARANLEYEKAVTVIQMSQAGLSVYAMCKALGNRSSLFRQNLLKNAQAIVDGFESGGQ